MKARPIAAACLGLLALNGVALAQTPPAKDTIIAALAAEGTVLDPARYAAGVDLYFIGQMFEQLVRFDPEQKPAAAFQTET